MWGVLVCLLQSFRFGGHIAQVADCILRTFKFSNFVPFGARKTNGSVSDKTLFGVGKRGKSSREWIYAFAHFCTNWRHEYRQLTCHSVIVSGITPLRKLMFENLTRSATDDQTSTLKSISAFCCIFTVGY